MRRSAAWICPGLARWVFRRGRIGEPSAIRTGSGSPVRLGRRVWGRDAVLARAFFRWWSSRLAPWPGGTWSSPGRGISAPWRRGVGLRESRTASRASSMRVTKAAASSTSALPGLEVGDAGDQGVVAMGSRPETGRAAGGGCRWRCGRCGGGRRRGGRGRSRGVGMGGGYSASHGDGSRVS